jgi:DNA-directed RNA polymerase subunit RPC12/RpoP
MNRPANASHNTFACIRCGATVPVEAAACPACSLAIYPEESSGEGYRCAECGGEVPVDDTICPHCGAEAVAIVKPPAEPEGDDEYVCSECGGEVAVDDMVCPHCGADVEAVEKADEYICPECGGDVAAGDKVCPNCGADVAAVEAADEYICSECGGDVAVDDKVCPRCGADVTAIEAVDEYICSTCGGEWPVDGTVCPRCGADVEAREKAPPERRRAVPRERAVTVQEVGFMAEAVRLPEEYASYFTPAEGGKLGKVVIPAREPKVGDLTIQSVYSEIVVSVGRHTEGRFLLANEAVDFVRDVLTDRIVFRFDGDEVEMYEPGELSDQDEIDWSYYVWSGPLRNRRTGIDWYRPPEG